MHIGRSDPAHNSRCALDALATSGARRLDLTGTTAPSSTGTTAATALTGRGWTVVVPSATPPASDLYDYDWVDTFNRANATGLAGVGNGWSAATGSAGANIVSNDLVRTDIGAGYQMIVNPGPGSLPANYRVIMVVPHASLGQFLGICGRWNGTNGARILLNASGVQSVGEASGPFDGNVSTTPGSPTMPASWSVNQDHMIAMDMTGTTLTLLVGTQESDLVSVCTATVSTNSSATGTSFGICGVGGVDGVGRVFREVGITY